MKLPEQLVEKLSGKKGLHYVLALLFLGICLMLLPVSGPETREETLPGYSVEQEEERLAHMLSLIQGAGECRVLLSVQAGVETVLAKDHDETLVLSKGAGQSTVTVQQRNPTVQGAVILSAGCGDAHVRYDILSAVMAYTGLSADKITICPIEQ